MTSMRALQVSSFPPHYASPSAAHAYSMCCLPVCTYVCSSLWHFEHPASLPSFHRFCADVTHLAGVVLVLDKDLWMLGVISERVMVPHMGQNHRQSETQPCLRMTQLSLLCACSCTFPGWDQAHSHSCRQGSDGVLNAGQKLMRVCAHLVLQKRVSIYRGIVPGRRFLGFHPEKQALGHWSFPQA